MARLDGRLHQMLQQAQQPQRQHVSAIIVAIEILLSSALCQLPPVRATAAVVTALCGRLLIEANWGEAKGGWVSRQRI